jgi:hypothetical protein
MPPAAPVIKTRFIFLPICCSMAMRGGWNCARDRDAIYATGAAMPNASPCPFA